MPCRRVRSSDLRPAAAKFGSTPRRDLVGGVQGVQVRGVAVRRFRFGIIIEPFLQATVRSDLVRRQPGALLLEVPGADRRPGRGFQRRGRCCRTIRGAVACQSSDRGRRAASPLAVEAVLRRIGRAGDEPAGAWAPRRDCRGRRATTPSEWGMPIAEPAIEREGVMFPQVMAEPSRAADGRAPAARPHRAR